ncbi:helix-turn-helix domain-containing protein [Dyadobacter sp. Leaf189]|uniref:helix-turn-helix domain-containing protein n=1 Tax=Dyadobacter sp. Leaf189 TaxID=1736295 RepID=UPI0006FA45B2|nr:helix-turn-helix transcriptional regulator [Dyadobacter sp. Leaf189]KQS33004.1 transcriptional regulator [Dyadobacter sp. Leaf189]
MITKKLKTYTLEEIKDKYIGENGTPERDQFEYELKMELMGRMIKEVRKERKLTQAQLGELVGVRKAQISKLESSANSATLETLVRVFKAMQAEVFFNIKIDNHHLRLC